MSQLIITTDVSSIRPVFSEGTAENIKRYNQLKKLFENTKEYRIFAEPVPAGGQKVAWHTEYEGKIIPFRKLDEEEQEKAKGLLKTEVNKIYKTIVAVIDEDQNRKRLFNLIDSFIEIPDYDDIYLVQNADGRKNFCIVRWGFINDDFNAPKNLIANLIPLKVASVNIRAIKGNNKIADNEKIFFDYNGKTEEYTTDNKGRIYLQDISLLTKITAYQIDENEVKQYEQEFLVENDSEITFFIGNQSLPKQTVSVQTMDDNDNILSNVTLRIKYDDVDFENDTNQQGICHLGELFVDTKVTCHQIKNKKIVKTNTFDVKQGKSIYFVNVIEHKSKGNVKIRVVDENLSVIPFAKIQVKFPDGTERYFESDEKGNFEINDMPFKEDIVFRQMIDNLPQYQQIIRFTDENKVFDFKGKVVKTPYDYTRLIVKVLNSNNEPIPNLKVVVDNGVKSYNQITNSDGLAEWQEIDCSKKTVINVENRGKKRREEIKCEGQETEHIIKLGKKLGLWWLWLLLILALIALGVIFVPKLLDKPPANDSDTTSNNIVVVDSSEIEETYVGMKFIVIDENNNFIENAKINITFGDKTLEKKTNSKGEVIFESLVDSTQFVNAKITAPNFKEQSLTFKITKEKIITMSNNSVEISEQILPCGTQIESKGYHSTIQTFNMKKTSGQFKLFYNMFDIADKIIVYKGHASDISNDKIIWQAPDFESRYHTVFVNFDADSLITVEIQGGDTTRTEWYFIVNCP